MAHARTHHLRLFTLSLLVCVLRDLILTLSLLLILRRDSRWANGRQHGVVGT